MRVRLSTVVGVSMALAVGVAAPRASSTEEGDFANMIFLAPVSTPEAGVFSENLNCTVHKGCTYCPSVTTYWLCINQDTRDEASRPESPITNPDQNVGAPFNRRYVP